MSGIWLLPTRSRRDLCQGAIDSFAGKNPDPVIVIQDGDEDPYDPPLSLPDGWTFQHNTTRTYISGPMRDVFAMYPDADYYGWLADDLRSFPKHDDALHKLKDAAGSNFLAYTNDNWMSKDKNIGSLNSGVLMSGALCWGGDLVRRVGWWGPPMVTQAYVDVIWSKITSARTTPLFRYLHHVVVDHWNWRTGKRARDADDEVSADYKELPKRLSDDMNVGKSWLKSPEFQAAVSRAYEGIQ